MKLKIKQASIVYVSLYLLSMTFVYGQGTNKLPQYKPLKLGDKVPDFALVNLINYPLRKAKFSDFQGKVVIFDIWHTGCQTCIESWSKLESLQRKFEGKIQILLLNPYQDSTAIRQLINKRKKAGVVNLTLPSVCKDSTLLRLFPFVGLPHYVIVDDNGIVTSISNSINAHEIQAILDGSNVTKNQKNLDPRIAVDYSKPLFSNHNGSCEQPILWRSILTHYPGKISSTEGIRVNSDNGSSSIYVVNGSILDMYRFAYSDTYLDVYKYNLARLPLSRIVLDVKDSSKYMSVINDEEQNQNLYVYQLTTGRSFSQNELQKMMKEDLFRYFGLSVKWEKRRISCLVFWSIDSALFKYRSGPKILYVDDAEIKLNNVTISEFIKRMENSTRYYLSKFPIIDETSYSGKIGGIEILTNVYNHKLLDKELQKNGLRLTVEERSVNILVIQSLKLDP